MKHRTFVAFALVLAFFVRDDAAAQYVRLHVVKSDEDFSRTLVATGLIASVDRTHSRVLLKPSKPFWGPVERGSELIALWPTQVQLSVALGVATPITIDGKKGSFDDLTAGQNATIQYLIRFTSTGALSSLACFARRIDIVSSSPRSKADDQKSARQK